MKYKLLITLAVVISVVGCKKDDASLGTLYTVSDEEITFTSEDNWDSKSTITTSSTLSKMDVYAYYTPGSTWDGVETVTNFMTNQEVEKVNGVWSYSPVRYWPTNTNDNISFFAFSPYGVVTTTTDATTNKHTFSHSTPALAKDGVDLVASVAYDKNCESGSVVLNFQHLLTKIMINAKLTQLMGDASTYEAVDGETFIINGVTIGNAYTEGDLSFSYDDKTIEWKLNTDVKGEIIAAQNNALLSKDSEDAVLIVGEDYKSVMASNEAIFVMPQLLEESEPTIQVRIRRSYEVDSQTVEVIYETVAMTIPTTTIDEWEMGEEIAINISVDLDNLAEYDTPLTVTSEVFWFSETTVEVDMHSNIYIYSSLSDIVAQSDNLGNMYGEFMVCTNYDYNLRVPHHRVELDGEITSSRGFVFCSDDFNGMEGSYTLEYLGYKAEDSDSEFEIFLPTLLNLDKEEIVYVTKDNLEDNGYTLVTTINDDNSESYTVNGIDIYFDNHDFGYYLKNDSEEFDLNDETYAMLYYDTDTNKTITEFEYNGTEIKLDDFEDDESKVYFKIKIAPEYEFNFSVAKSTREDMGLYVSTAVSQDSSYGINKEGDDAVYTLCLSVNASHLADAEDNMFDDIIGVKMISNGGGVITQLFPVTLTAATTTETETETANDE